MKPDSPESSWEKEEFLAVLGIIDSEINRQLSDHIRSATSLTNRAALLVTSSLIFVSIPKNGDENNCWFALALAFGMSAAILGVIALFFHPKSQELKLSSLEEQLVGKTEIEAMRAIAESKRITLAQGRARVLKTSKFVIWGFVSLAMSLVCTVAYSLIGG